MADRHHDVEPKTWCCSKIVKH